MIPMSKIIGEALNKSITEVVMPADIDDIDDHNLIAVLAMVDRINQRGNAAELYRVMIKNFPEYNTGATDPYSEIIQDFEHEEPSKLN